MNADSEQTIQTYDRAALLRRGVGAGRGARACELAAGARECAS